MNAAEIAQYLVGQNSHDVDNLLIGARRAQSALQGAYLVILWRTDLTGDRCRVGIVRLTAFRNSAAALECAAAALDVWIGEGARPEGADSGYTPRFEHSPVPVQDNRSVQRAGDVQADMEHFAAITLGPFPGSVMGRELVTAFSGEFEKLALGTFLLGMSDPAFSAFDTEVFWAADERPAFPSIRQWPDNPLPLGPRGFSSADLLYDSLTSTRALVELPTAGQIRSPESPIDGQNIGPKRMPAWTMAQILWNTGRVSERQQLEWVESRITKLDHDKVSSSPYRPFARPTSDGSPASESEHDGNETILVDYRGASTEADCLDCLVALPAAIETLRVSGTPDTANAIINHTGESFKALDLRPRSNAYMLAGGAQDLLYRHIAVLTIMDEHTRYYFNSAVRYFFEQLTERKIRTIYILDNALRDDRFASLLELFDLAGIATTTPKRDAKDWPDLARRIQEHIESVGHVAYIESDAEVNYIERAKTLARGSDCVATFRNLGPEDSRIQLLGNPNN
ncbi:MAG TPA: hypothetical protein VHW71_05155 [Steroidobacteraceae bacterium]|nr:hypothetical protein [Steroidobacteraceae bacterium]